MDLSFYGLGLDDNPLFDAIADAATLYAGATIQSHGRGPFGPSPARLQPCRRHASRHEGQSQRFCVFNDISAAIVPAIAAGHRVAYVDLDAHHGDGVQASFYDDPRVLTISVHESGHYLFPGTGEVDETGMGDGEAGSINVPLPPGAGDEAILEAIDRIVLPAVRAFAPTVLVTQTGCDTHHSDPLTDLAATLPLYPALAARHHALAHEVCSGRWLIVGGGGYDPVDVTPRAWTAFIGTVLGHEHKTCSCRSNGWPSPGRRGTSPSPPAGRFGTRLHLGPHADVDSLLAQIEATALAKLKRRHSRPPSHAEAP